MTDVAHVAWFLASQFVFVFFPLWIEQMKLLSLHHHCGMNVEPSSLRSVWKLISAVEIMRRASDVGLQIVSFSPYWTRH